jgi:predicted nucleic acid-binding protein
MIYLDTSALLKLYILEEGSELVQSTIAAQDHPLPIWDILQAEFSNALRLKVFWKEITAPQAATQIKLFEHRIKKGVYYVPLIDRASLMSRFMELSLKTQKLGCRTLDILHVAYALEIGATRFITFDQRQGKLANQVGLKP